MVWGSWASGGPNCLWEVLKFPMGASGLNAGGKEGDLIENLWPRYAAPLPPAAFSQLEKCRAFDVTRDLRAVEMHEATATAVPTSGS